MVVANSSLDSFWVGRAGGSTPTLLEDEVSGPMRKGRAKEPIGCGSALEKRESALAGTTDDGMAK